MRYTISPTTVYYNTRTQQRIEHFTGKQGEVRFDSLGEYNCYLTLRKLNLPIEIHKLSKPLNWKVDFTVTFVGKSNHPLLDRYSLTSDKTLWVEYKGVIDDKTIDRVSAIPPILRKSLVIVTYRTKTFKVYDKVKNNIIDVVTLGLPELRELL